MLETAGTGVEDINSPDTWRTVALPAGSIEATLAATSPHDGVAASNDGVADFDFPFLALLFPVPLCMGLVAVTGADPPRLGRGMVLACGLEGS